MQFLHKVKIGFYGPKGEDKYTNVKVTSYKRLSYCEVAKEVKKNNPKKTIWYLDLKDIIQLN